jgi:hypothetical protein
MTAPFFTVTRVASHTSSPSASSGRVAVGSSLAKRSKMRWAAGAAGFQHEERIGAVPALPDLLPGRDLVASFLHQPGAGDRVEPARAGREPPAALVPDRVGQRKPDYLLQAEQPADDQRTLRPRAGE